MTSKLTWFSLILFFATGAVLPGEDLDINKFSEVSNGKESAVKVVYLKSDGTEGLKGDAGVVPAIKLELSPMPKSNLTGIELMAQTDHLVMQDIASPVVSKDGSIGVDVWASPDFKRASSKDPSGQVGPGDFNGFVDALPDMDFWVIRGSQHTYFSYLKPGGWTHVEGKFGATTGHFEFHVPPGVGVVYLMNFTAKP